MQVKDMEYKDKMQPHIKRNPYLFQMGQHIKFHVLIIFQVLK